MIQRAWADAPVAIPPAQLPACGTEAEQGGWILRDFNARGSDTTSETPARPRGLRLGEPCMKSDKLNIPNLLTEVEPEDGEWDSALGGTGGGGCSGCGGGGGGGGESANTGHPTYASQQMTLPSDSTKWVAITRYGISTIKSGGLYYSKWVLCMTRSGVLSGRQILASTTGATGSYSTGAATPYFSAWNQDGFCGSDLPNNQGVTYTGAQTTGKATMAESEAAAGFGPLYWCHSTSSVDTSCTTGVKAVLTSNEEIQMDGTIPSAMHVGNSILYTPATTGYIICATNISGAGQTTLNITQGVKYNATNPALMNAPTDYERQIELDFFPIGTTECANIITIHLWVCVWVSNGAASYGCTETIWDYEAYARARPYDGSTPDEAICNYVLDPRGGCGPILFPDPNAPEESITCIISYSEPGNPITSIGDFFVGLPEWAGCMVTPLGWDRKGMIEAKWSTGNLGEMQDAFTASVPNGIGCGVVASIPMWSGTITLDTCAVDVAPAIVKSVVGWVMVLGLCFLIIRRIMWSVGSK